MQKITRFLRAEARPTADIFVTFAVAVLLILPLGVLFERYQHDLLGFVATQPRGGMLALLGAYVVVVFAWTVGSFWAADRLVRWTYRSGAAIAPRYVLVAAGTEMSRYDCYRQMSKEEADAMADAILSNANIKIFRP